MSDLPSGIVTFLLTDIENSTALWQQQSRLMPLAVARHDTLALEVLSDHRGVLVKSRGEGDSLFIVFARATDAIAAACALQDAYQQEPWTTEMPLRVRMALHTGEADLRDGDYYGISVNRCARLRAIGHGGQILLSQAICELVYDDLPESISIRQLGPHRLKDLQRREHVYQICHTNLPVDFPALRSLDSLPNNLRLQLTSFIGREEEITRVQELLPTTRLLTLTGMGGSGKTRLALQVAADALDEYPDGVWFVELDAITATDPAPIYRAIAVALGIREAPGQTLLATINDYLRARSLLLLFDNCEHLIEPCASVVQTLLRACPNLRILATSRETLSVAGEKTYQVPNLTLPPLSPCPLPEEILPYESVKLFVDRAQADNPNFRLTPENAPAIAQLCCGLDGMPLALELAAARVRVLTVQEIAARLDDRFLLLTGGPRSEPLRHRSLSGLIEWSYDLLAEPERALLRRLSVFTGGWTLTAAEAIAAGNDERGMMKDESDSSVSAHNVQNLTLRTRNSQTNIHHSSFIIHHTAVFDLLVRLVEMSLVVAEEQKETMRYRLLETVRVFGLKKLEEAGETEPIRNRHLDYFLQLAEESESKLTGPEQAIWLERLERDHDNLRAALTWAAVPDLHLRMAGALCRFWVMRGYYTEGRAMLEGALSQDHSVSPAIRAKALTSLGVLTYRLNENTVARAYLEQSLEIRQQLGDEDGIAEVLNSLGIVFRNLGDYEGAREYCLQSLELHRKLNDRWGTAAALNTLGMVLLALGDTDSARESYRECLSIYRELGDTARTAALLCNLAGVEYSLLHFEDARQFYEEGLIKLKELGDRDNTATTLSNLGETLLKLGEYTKAQQSLLEGLEMLYQLGNRNILAFALDSLGRIAQIQRLYTRSACLFAATTAMRTEQCTPLPPSQQESLNEEILTLQNAMGEKAFTAMWARGGAMSLEEVVTFALDAGARRK